MTTLTSADVPFDPERLKYVTENYTSLKGLTLASVGLWLVFMNIEQVLPAEHWKLLRFLVDIIAFPLFIASYRYIPRYYERRFGYVEEKIKIGKGTIIGWAIGILGFLLLFIFKKQVDIFITQVHLRASDPEKQLNLLTPLVWTIFWLGSFRWLSRDFTRARFYVLSLVVIPVTLTPLYAIWHPEVKAMLTWKLLNASAVGLSLIVLGLFNHFTLVRLLRHKSLEASHG